MSEDSPTPQARWKQHGGEQRQERQVHSTPLCQAVLWQEQRPGEGDRIGEMQMEETQVIENRARGGQQ